MKSDVPVKLLAPLIEDEARTTLDPHLVCVLIVGGEEGKCCAGVNVPFNYGEIHAERLCDFTLNIPSGDISAVSKECNADCVKHSCEHAVR